MKIPWRTVFCLFRTSKKTTLKKLPLEKNAPAYAVTAAIVKAIGFVLEQPPAKAFSFRLSESSMIEMEKISEDYLKYHSGQEFSALELYKILG